MFLCITCLLQVLLEMPDTSAPGSACSVCLQDCGDHRVLPCMHSFCAPCIDRLASDEGGDEFKCPVCRFRVRLPENGAAGLLQDITRPAESDTRCKTCALTGETSAPSLWCATCKVALCNKHIPEHFTTAAGLAGTEQHVIVSLPTAVSPSSPHCGDAASLCPEHHSPLEFYCTGCEVAVCGRCTAMGSHHGHEHIVDIKVKDQELKQRVEDNVKKLVEQVLPRVEATKSTVEMVGADLTSRAREVRAKIRRVEKCAVDTIHAVAEQKLQEVDDIETERHKLLDRQLDEVKYQTKRLEAVITLTDKLAKAGVAGRRAASLLKAIDERAATLANEDVVERPAHHSQLDFKEVTEDELIAQAGTIIGTVLPCDATAVASRIKGDLLVTKCGSQPVSFIVEAKTENGEPAQEGVDAVRAEWASIPHDVANPPPMEVTPQPDGCYAISCSPSVPGDYKVAVFVNDKKLASMVSVVFNQRWFCFDEAECQAGLEISDDNLSVSHPGDYKFASVLGSSGKSEGRHAWHVKIGPQSQGRVNIGVAPKPGLTAKIDNYQMSYCWYGLDGQMWKRGNSSPGVGGFQSNDVLHLELDCDDHTLTITNPRTENTSTITDLPAVPLHPYFSMYHKDESISLEF